MAMDLPFAYQITRSKRKTVAIYVRDGRADVRVPLQASNQWIEEFVQQKVRWVSKQIAEQRRKAAESFTLSHGAEILYLGRPVRIFITTNSRRGVVLRNGVLYIPGDDLFSRSADHFYTWLRQRAEEYICPRATALAARLGLAHRLQQIRLRKTKSQWGNCSSTGVVQYNWLIMLAPAACVDYLIAHEICHLQHMNHSSAYWALVESICPDYRQSRKWIKDNEHRFRGQFT